jgi:hypothetical protein
MGSGALRGRVRVKLEGPVADRDLARMTERGNRAFEPALADVTPRAHDVRPDLHIHSRSNLRDDGVIPPQTAPRERMCPAGEPVPAQHATIGEIRAARRWTLSRACGRPRCRGHLARACSRARCSARSKPLSSRNPQRGRRGRLRGNARAAAPGWRHVTLQGAGLRRLNLRAHWDFVGAWFSSAAGQAVGPGGRAVLVPPGRHAGDPGGGAGRDGSGRRAGSPGLRPRPAGTRR